MRLPKRGYYVRDIEAGYFLENFFISAITSIIGIRVFLHVTGYPMIAPGNFHIAHMLWGGVLMLVALIAVLAFLNRELKVFASVFGGIGFGTFIDELGKFITSDNNYHYQPTIALLYVIFVLLFLLFRAIEKRFVATQYEYAVNALEFAKEALLHDFDRQEKSITMKLLKASDRTNPVISSLLKALRGLPATPPEEVGTVTRLRRNVRKVYRRIIQQPLFTKLTIWFFAIATLVNFFPAVFDVYSFGTWSDWGEFLSASLSTVFVIIGINYIRIGKRVSAYEFFKWGTLVLIFLKQFFVFYEEEFAALSGLLVNILILSVLQYVIDQEKAIVPKRMPSFEEIRMLLTGSRE